MAMVRPFQLIFDQDPAVGPDVFAEDVRTERSNRAFLRLQFQIDAERFAENF